MSKTKLTVPFDEIVEDRVRREPAFAAGLLEEAAQCMLNGEISVGLSRVICLYLIGPLRRGSRVLRLRVSDHVIVGCRDCNKRDKDQKESSEAHGFPFPL